MPICRCSRLASALRSVCPCLRNGRVAPHAHHPGRGHVIDCRVKKRRPAHGGCDGIAIRRQMLRPGRDIGEGLPGKRPITRSMQTPGMFCAVLRPVLQGVCVLAVHNSFGAPYARNLASRRTSCRGRGTAHMHGWASCGFRSLARCALVSVMGQPLERPLVENLVSPPTCHLLTPCL